MKKKCSKCFEEKEIALFPIYVALDKVIRYRTYCKSCHKKRKDLWRLQNKELHNKKCRDWVKNNKEKRKLSQRLYILKNKEKISEKAKKLRTVNRHLINASTSSRRKRVKFCTPKWVDKAHKKRIRLKYLMCAEITLVTGVQHHVDHIAPIRGKNVCGLHVFENLQILPASENLSKSGKFRCS